MKVFDIKPEPKTVWDAHTAYWNAFTARMVQTSINAKKVPVTSLETCWTCGKELMARPFQWYHEGRCQDIADIQADDWRNE